MFRRTMGDILRARDFTVVELSDPARINETLQPENQVVLLDLKLNGISGFDILEIVRTQHPELPIILVTGYRKEMGSVIEAAHEFNVTTCLYKPLEVQELLDVLAQIQHRELAQVLGQSL